MVFEPEVIQFMSEWLIYIGFILVVNLVVFGCFYMIKGLIVWIIGLVKKHREKGVQADEEAEDAQR